MSGEGRKSTIIPPISKRPPVWMIDLAIIAFLWILAAIWIDPRGDFAVVDDWVYALAVQAILHDGVFALPSPSSANIFLQAYWGVLFCLPFGFSYTALKISTLVTAVIGSWAGYGFMREAKTSRSMAYLGAAMIALNPIYFQMAFSFMTDVPFTALTATALFFFAYGMRRRDWRFVVLALALAESSILIRQFGLLFVVGFGVGIAARSKYSWRSIAALIGMTALGVAIHMAFQHWLLASGRTPNAVITSVHDFGPGLDPKQNFEMLVNIALLMPYLGLMLAPVYVATGFAGLRDAIVKRPMLVSIIFVLTLLFQAAGARIRHIRLPYYGLNLEVWGLGPMSIHDISILRMNQPALPFPEIVWTPIFVVGALVMAAITVDLARIGKQAFRDIVRRSRSELAWHDASALFITLSYGALLGLMTVKPNTFDRYLLALVAPILMLVIARTPRPTRWPRVSMGLGWALIMCFAVYALLGTKDYLTWMRARLAATNALEAAGVARDRIDGGYEYNGRYLNSPDIYPGYYGAHRIKLTKSWWWVRDDLYVIAAGPLPGYSIQARYPYYRLLSRNWEQVVTLRRLPGSLGERTNLPPKPRGGPS